MKFLKYIVAASLIAISSIVSADTKSDLDLIFEQTSTLSSVELMADVDIDKTEGAVAPIVVYGLMVGGRIAYVGISNNVKRRTREHLRTKSFDRVVELGRSSSRTNARVIEQTNINRYNTINNGMNRINSVSPRSSLASRISNWSR